MARMAWRWPGALLGAALFLLAGCGRDYELKIRLPADSQVAPQGEVFLDGVRVGKVTEVERAGGKLVASVVIEDRQLAEQKIKPGVLATARGDKGVDLDASRVDADAKSLPSGSTIEGHTKLEFLVKKYAVWQTVVAVAVGILAQVVMVWTLRSFFKLGVVVISLILSGALACLLYPFAVPAVERIYVEIEKAKETRIEREGKGATTPAPEPEDKQPVGQAPQRETAGQAPASVTAQATPAAQTIEEVVKQVPRPSPQVVAFFGSWLILFLVVQIIMGRAFRATRATK